MNGASLDSYHELASTLNPTAVHQYLAANDWELEAEEQGVREIWRLPGDRARVMLPLATDYVDFSQRFSETLKALSLIHQWPMDTLAERIAAVRADLFFVRLDQEMLDGTIPFKQAEKTLEGLFKMMKAAATTADDPTHSHRGRRSGTVTDFLDDNIRLGHTKRGSFVFTVATRLGDPVPDDEAGNRVVPFPRRVMETLATGLTDSHELALRWDTSTAEQAVSRGLRANLVDALVDMTEGSRLRELDLSFDWAVAEPRPTGSTSRIRVGRDAMAGLSRVRDRLVRREQPPRSETLLGRVRSLTREEPDEDDQTESTIVLVADVNGRARNVHVPLSADDYQWAILAHFRQLPFTVTGNLVFERGAWRLTDPITVDASFLRHNNQGESQT